MTKHVSSGGDATSSPRDAATESLPTRDAADAADAAAQHLPQGAAGDPGRDGTKDVKALKDLKDAAGTTDSGSVRTEVLAKDVTQDSAKGSGAARSAASSTADTRLGGAWASPDAQNAATIGAVPSTSAAAKKARTKARGPWYRRRVVVGAAGVALLAGSFGAGWGGQRAPQLRLPARSGPAAGSRQRSGHARRGPGRSWWGRTWWPGRARWADARRRPWRPGRPRWPERPRRSGRGLRWSRPNHPQRRRLQRLRLERRPAVGLRLG